MSWWVTVATGARSLTVHRLRSVLTALGILGGVAAVIVVAGLGQGSADSIDRTIADLGTSTFTVIPIGPQPVGRGLTVLDAQGLADRRDAPDVVAVAPVMEAAAPLKSGAAQVSTEVVGSTPAWFSATNQAVAQGSPLTQQDVAGQRADVVLGPSTAARLRVSVGDDVTISGIPFHVIGILRGGDVGAFGNPNDMALVPITTGQDVVFGPSDQVQEIVLRAGSPATLGAASQETVDLLLQTHHLTDPGQANFELLSPAAALKAELQINAALYLLLTSVGGIALLIAGIGVMNIMLVSVTERTSEIGLRKALGATPWDLLFQFLVESAVLTGLGGLMGVGAAFLSVLVVPRLTHRVSIDITLTPVLVSVGVSIAIGLVFGIYPALRAARLAPVEALRSS